MYNLAKSEVVAATNMVGDILAPNLFNNVDATLRTAYVTKATACMIDTFVTDSFSDEQKRNQIAAELRQLRTNTNDTEVNTLFVPILKWARLGLAKRLSEVAFAPKP